MISGRLYFEIAFPVVPSSVKDVWLALKEFLGQRGLLPEKFHMSQIAGHREGMKSERDLALKVEDIEDVIGLRELDGFHLHTGYSDDRISFALQHAKEAGTQSVLICDFGPNARTPAEWSALIERISIQCPTIGGWQCNNLYRCWQWASWLYGYERRFGPIPPQLKTYVVRSLDGIGPDREVIDFSKNPGRPKELLPTIRFYPAAEMWLGPHFWEHALCTKDEVLAAEFFLEKRDTPHFLYLKSWPEPFTRPDGEQGRVQQKLWRLLFHEDCEWPPGSGSISEVPVYGPPELMPMS